MLKVGITGGMGTGKSTVCRIFSVLGIPTFDADKEAKELYNINAILKTQVIERFGQSVYENDIFQKQKMAQIVFNDVAALKDLNTIVHPLVISQGEDWFKNQTSHYAIKEAALLIESGGYKTMDKIIVVQTSLENRLGRLKKRDNRTEEEIKKRIEKQMPEEEKETYADFIIRNNNEDKLIEQVLEVHNKLLAL